MRTFGEDFEFDYFESDVCVRTDARAVRTKGMRFDTYRTIVADKTEYTDNAERQARVKAHTERIQREMQELGIKKGSR